MPNQALPESECKRLLEISGRKVIIKSESFQYAFQIIGILRPAEHRWYVIGSSAIISFWKDQIVSIEDPSEDYPIPQLTIGELWF